MKSDLCIGMLKALADETRWRIVRTLLNASCTVGELASRLDVSAYNASKHIRILRETGILVTQRKGKMVECRIALGFRKKLSQNESVLDLGCCSFRFNRPAKGSKRASNSSRTPR